MNNGGSTVTYCKQRDARYGNSGNNIDGDGNRLFVTSHGPDLNASAPVKAVKLAVYSLLTQIMVPVLRPDEVELSFSFQQLFDCTEDVEHLSSQAKAWQSTLSAHDSVGY